MDEHQREVFHTVVRAVLLLAVGALWAIVVRLLVALPDPLAVTVLAIIVLVCLLYLVVSD